MTQKRLFLFQTLLEALIPLLGYFQWNWDLSFILLFYLLDWFLATGITLAKGLKRVNYSKDPLEKRLLFQSLPVAILLMISACLLIAMAIVQLEPGLMWTERIWQFLVYKDLGIEQGLILVPLIVLNGVVVYRQQFLMTGRFRTHTVNMITQPLVKQGILLLGSAGLLFGIVQFVRFPGEVLIFLAIAAISLYRWLVIRKVQ